MITEGSPAPTVRLPGTPLADEAAIDEYDLRDAVESGPAVLNFFLFDFHPDCTENLCDLHDLAWFDLAEDVTVFGISTDRTFSHRAFAEQEGLRYPLLSDSDGSVAEAYGVRYDEFNGHRNIAKRSVFVVDTDRTVRYAWCTEDPSVQPDWSAVETAVRGTRASAPR